MSKLLKVTDLIPGLQKAIARLPQIAKGGLATLALMNELPYSLGVVVERNARVYANRTALLFEKEQYTYADFNSIVNQYANYFIEKGIARKQVVAVFLENRSETIIITAALAKIGAIASLVNPNQRDESLVHSMTIKESNYFIIGAELLSAFKAVQKEIVKDEDLLFSVNNGDDKNTPSGFINLNDAIANSSKENPSTTKKVRAKDHFAYIFTSGTTGLPKASIQTHKQWLRSMHWFGDINAGFEAADNIYISIPFYHANALMIGWASAFSNGSTIIMRRKFSASEFWSDIVNYKATAFIYIGEICRYLLNTPPSKLDKKNQVNKVIGNGLRPEIWSEFKTRFDIENIYEFYAASDSNIIFTNTFNVDNCVGWSPTNFEIVEYDIDNDEVIRTKEGRLKKVEKGEVGLMVSKITSLFPFPGYANKKANNKKILRDCFSEGDEYFNTGDLMRNIGFKHSQFVDRVGDTFRWKGENVATAEVESIINQYDSIENVAVYGVQIPTFDGRAGMAAITLKSNKEDFDFGDFYKHLKQKLPAYAVPIFLRICNSLDVTHTQKIKKGSLKKQGFSIEEIEDEIKVCLPKSNAYTTLDKKIYKGIEANEYKF